MKKHLLTAAFVVMALGAAFLGFAGPDKTSSKKAPAKPSAPPAAYHLKGMEMEGCACDLYCPCIFRQDATADHCRALNAWSISEGMHGDTDLRGLSFALSITKSGKNIEAVMGQMEGVLFVPAGATEAQRKAIADIMQREMGPAFSRLDVRSAPVKVKNAGERHELSIDGVADLKISALKGKDGKPTVIENAPSPLALPAMYCAKADVHTYNDGAAKWDFAERNGYYGAFEMKSK